MPDNELLTLQGSSGPSTQPPKYERPLFMQQTTSPGAPPITLLIACQECNRSNFTTIHALLNHARIIHGILYKSHEHCVESCGKIVIGADADEIRRLGTEASSKLLPGVRGIFQRAVGGLDPSSTALMFDTLGVHAESPALAQFLGKQRSRRQIKVYEPEGDIDIEEISEGENNKPKWVPRFWSRSEKLVPGSPELSPVSSRESNDRATKLPGHSGAPEAELPKQSSSGSRFHLTRRLIITDWSLYIPERMLFVHLASFVASHASLAEYRLESQKSHTHKWMLSVTSPSYVCHLAVTKPFHAHGKPCRVNMLAHSSKRSLLKVSRTHLRQYSSPSPR